MFFHSLATLAVAATVAAKELPKDEFRAAELYDNGLTHQRNVDAKSAFWEEQEAAGAYDSWNYQAISEFVPCVDGLITVDAGNPSQIFKCKNIDLYSFRSHADLGSAGRGSSSWGWTSPEGREFVAIGQIDGTAFIEISPEGQIVYLGRLPFTSVESRWREIRGYKEFMLIGSEAVGHGVQIFDMSKLLDIDPASPKNFTNEEDLTGFFNETPIGRTHNVVVNEESGWGFAVGAQPRNSTCHAGIIFIDLSDPSAPTTPGCASEDGYVHDAQCLIYRGPDTQYVGREICYGYNEDTLTIYDVTDKTAPTIISRTSYEGAAYTHQGWVLDPNNQEYLILDDELDERDRVGPAASGYPITYIWDIKSLAAPKNTGFYRSPAYSIDHNQYVIDGLSFQSNYGAGLRVLDVSSIPSDPTGAGVKEVAFIDIYPEDDAQPNGGSVAFVGTWSSYAFFPSGFLYINTIERGSFVVKVTDNVRRGNLRKRWYHW